MSMTLSRKNVYRRSWFRRECKINMKARRKEYNRRVRHAKVTEDSTVSEYKNLRKLYWNTVT